MKWMVLCLFLSNYLYVYGQDCDSDRLQILEIRASETDEEIGWELNKHFSFYNPSCASNKILLVHLVGSFDNPSNTLLFPSFAANNGYHALSLKYSNSIAAQTACGDSSDPNCYSDFRKEILEGINYSDKIEVSHFDGVYNRLEKLIIYLIEEYPLQGWGAYITMGEINWERIIISGHSQGGGHAALVAKEKKVKRVLMFASPNDYSTFYQAPATWTSQSRMTPDSLFYGFNNLNDDIVRFSDQFEIWSNLGMMAFGDSVNVDMSLSNYSNTRQLYTARVISGQGGNHSLMIRDNNTPIDDEGIPDFIDVWRYMLGLTSTTATIEPKMNDIITVYPNPTDDYLFISTNVPLDKSLALEFYSASGYMISKNFLLGNNTINIDFRKELPGLYTVRLVSSQGILSIKKFLVHSNGL